MPIAVFGQNSEFYMRKYEALAQGAATLRKNVERIEEFSSEFDGMMKKCIDYLGEYRTWWLECLHTEREQLYEVIEAAVVETTHCLDQGVEPVSGLGLALWSLAPEELQVVNCTVTTPNLQDWCQTWAVYSNRMQELCARPKSMHDSQALAMRPQEVPQEPPIDDYARTDLFAAVWENNVDLYGVESQQSARCTLPINFGKGGSYIALNGSTLLCLGATPASTAVYELELWSLQLTALPPLHSPREAAGVAKGAHFLYVFGGCDSVDLKSCEKYGWSSGQWQPLRDMQHVRSNFTPCTFRSLIYLLSPCTTHTIETFSPDTETFDELSTYLPALMRKSSSVSFVASGELCVLTSEKQMGRWRIESERKFRLSMMGSRCCSTQPALVVGAVVLIANNYFREEKVVKFSLESYAFI